MGMGGNGNGNGFMGMGGNGNRNSPSRTPLIYHKKYHKVCDSSTATAEITLDYDFQD